MSHISKYLSQLPRVHFTFQYKQIQFLYLTWRQSWKPSIDTGSMQISQPNSRNENMDMTQKLLCAI